MALSHNVVMDTEGLHHLTICPEPRMACLKHPPFQQHRPTSLLKQMLCYICQNSKSAATVIYLCQFICQAVSVEERPRPCGKARERVATLRRWGCRFHLSAIVIPSPSCFFSSVLCHFVFTQLDLPFNDELIKDMNPPCFLPLDVTLIIARYCRPRYKYSQLLLLLLRY